MTDVFLYGTLCHAPLRAVVLGRETDARPAQLRDHAVHWARGESFPLILKAPGALAEGVLVCGLEPAEVARLDYYEGGFGYALHEVQVRPDAASRPVAARVYMPQPGLWQPGAPWDLADWQARFGAVVTEAAHEFLAGFGHHRPVEQTLARYPMMLGRAASRLRARAPAPATLRRAAQPGDLRLISERQPYARFFAVEEADLSFRRFGGGFSAQVTRAGFVMADAVTVLPYDPRRDRVLVIEQFRYGPVVRGASEPWLIEPIAGRIDAGETPEEAARREALEEAGLPLHGLELIAAYYPSPAAVSEFLYSFLAVVDLPDSAAGLGGLEAEAEDIRAHVISFDRLMQVAASGELDVGPLLLSAFWLSRERERLRRDA